MNRLERISSILVQLQSKSQITAQQIAKQFDVSLRTVYRDIKTLGETGIPITGNVGVGYSLVDGYKLPPLLFTREETIAFLTAQKLIEKMSDSQNAKYYKLGMNKIKALLRYVEKDYLSNIENNINIMDKSESRTKLPTDITQCILKSICEQKAMHINYITKGNITSERDIEPVGCFYSNQLWYLIAFCKTKKDYRNFRIDRINHFKLKDETFVKTHPSLSEYIEKHKADEDCHQVIIRVDNRKLDIINDYKYYQGWIKEEIHGDKTDLYFRIFNLDHFIRWYISLADIAEIIQPEILKDKAREFYRSINI